MQDFAGDEHAFAGVERVVNDGVGRFHKLGHAAGGFVERVGLGDAVTHVVRAFEQLVGDAVERLGGGRLRNVELARLGVLVEVRFANDVGHARFDDFQAVRFEVRLDVAVGAGVEVQQVFADDEHLRARVRAVVAHARHDVDGLLEATDGAVHATFAHAGHN